MLPSDPRYELAQARTHCYDLVLDSLREFEQKCKDQLAAAGGNEVLALDAPESVRSHAYELAFASDDEMFHSIFYDWLISRDLADDLLEVSRSHCSINDMLTKSLQMGPPFLEAYLRREPATVKKFELLWQFYVKNGQPLRAAEVLGALAESTQLVMLSNVLRCD